MSNSPDDAAQHGADQKSSAQKSSAQQAKKFSGNIFLFHAFDVGDDILLEKIKREQSLLTRPLELPKYFKNYHIPLTVELPHPNKSSKCSSVKIHPFGVVSLMYQIPFSEESLVDIRKELPSIDEKYKEKSVDDALAIFNKIKTCIVQPKFFHWRTSYLVIHVDSDTAGISTSKLKDEYGGIITSTLRFESETLSELQKNEMLETAATEYFKNDLILIDTDASFVYDNEHEDLLNFFEFANIQQLELQYFDRLLDQQLNVVYEKRQRKLGLKTYLPFIGALGDPLGELSRLRADISVITERLENSIKLAGEPYFTEIYRLLGKQMQLKAWQASISEKLRIIKDIRVVYQNKIDMIREDILSTLIIVLIFIELVVAIFK